MAYFIGLDLGGTNLKAGMLDQDANILCKFSVPTEAAEGPDHVIDVMVHAAERTLTESGVDKKDVAAIGIGAPGTLSHRKGVVYRTPNMPRWKDVMLRRIMRQRMGIPVNLENDANAAAYGEFWAGAGKDVDDMIMFTLGTGVGGGVITEGRLVHGFFENAAELGHMLVVPGGRLCGCGQRGCLEAYASTSSVVRIVNESIIVGEPSILKKRIDRAEIIECKDVADAVLEGDGLAARIWDQACRHLAVAFVALQHITNPHCVVMAGGMTLAGDLLLKRVIKHFDELTWDLIPDQPNIMLATLGTDAGLIGAAGLAMIELKNGDLVTG